MTSRPPLPPFAYEYHDDSGNWHRAYGNENCDFDEQGLMLVRHASINGYRSRQLTASSIGKTARRTLGLECAGL